ncbi:Sel1 repeat-containing protein [Ralstonia sp. 25mfcol4.1]|uniref:tetratricopeptide repeat protein n=1 Tax=Ralstonia sp. 25mfcol4.1 TaxID=1761899 RepID=UPI00087F67CE|nr:tetratricopeptide repeat protein [Ralstonia sp. 25mfcol4.1]SDO81379.1 Sel1 repeat-containing protein [Ralstonia sp. 25mfcol4.1]
MQATASATLAPTRAASRRLPRVHPLFAAATLAVTVAAAGVAGAAVWRHQSDTRHAELSQWQLLATSAGDAGALDQLQQAARAGETAARAALGETMMSRTDATTRADGERWLRMAADSGHVRAQFLLGKAAMLGTLASGRADQSLAWRLLDAAANGGDIGAAYYLGLLYRGGHGRMPDPASAARWFKVAADGGVAQAMFLLGNAYREGDGVAQDDARAVAWYEAAAEREHPASIQTLAMAYRHGELGLAQDDRNYRQHMAEAAHALKHPAINP